MQDNTFESMKRSTGTVAVLQARMGSVRLPAKILSEIAGRPMIGLIAERCASSKLVSRFVIATSVDPANDPVEAMCRGEGLDVFRGSEDDCLDRIYRAVQSSRPEHVVRLTGDNPLVDGFFLDEVIERYLDEEPALDYADTTISKTYPYGLSAEVMTFHALETTWREAVTAFDREHVTPFIRNHPERFRIRNLVCGDQLGHLRVTVDLPSDLQRMRLLFHEAGDPLLHWRSLVDILEAHPEWAHATETVQYVHSNERKTT